MQKQWIVAASLLICSQLQAQPTAKIIGGDPASTLQYPWMTSLQYVPFGADDLFFSSHFCGATLIAPRWILTAAHCVDSGRPDEIKAVLGVTNLNNQQDSDGVLVEQIVSHPNFNQGVQFNNDIALLRLSESVNRVPAEHASVIDTSMLADGDSITLVGWGTTDEANELFSPQLQQAIQPFYDTDTCRSIYGSNGDWISDNMVCSGGIKGVDSCFGDSGGPVVEMIGNRAIQHGIVSWGVGCDQAYTVAGFPEITSYPGVNTRVANYADWIDATINGLSLDSPLDFGEQPEDGSVFTLPVRVINNSGSDSFTISSIAFSPAFPFSVVNDDCAGENLAPGENCRVEVAFEAAPAGRREALLQVDTVDGQLLTSKVFANLNRELSVGGDVATLPGDWFSSEWRYRDSDEGGELFSNIVLSSGAEDVLLFAAEQSGTLGFCWQMSGEETGFQFLSLLLNDREVKALQFDNERPEYIRVDVNAGDLLTWIFDTGNPAEAVLSRVRFSQGSLDTESCTDSNSGGASGGSGGGGGGSAIFPLWLLLCLLIRRRF